MSHKSIQPALPEARVRRTSSVVIISGSILIRDVIMKNRFNKKRNSHPLATSQVKNVTHICKA